MTLELPYVLSGICAVVLTLLGLIWQELRNLNKTIVEILVANSEQKVKISSLESIVNTLPCMTKKPCS